MSRIKEAFHEEYRGCIISPGLYIGWDWYHIEKYDGTPETKVWSGNEPTVEECKEYIDMIYEEYEDDN